MFRSWDHVQSLRKMIKICNMRHICQTIKPIESIGLLLWLSEWTQTIFGLYRSIFLHTGQEPRAWGPAGHLPGRIRGNGRGNGEVLWCVDRKGTGTSGPGWRGSSQAMGGQQQAGGFRARQVKPTSRRQTEPRTSCRGCGAVGLLRPLG